MFEIISVLSTVALNWKVTLNGGVVPVVNYLKVSIFEGVCMHEKK
jgi:hypothetical protein